MIVVGSNVILRYDGTDWNEMTPPKSGSVQLYGVWGSSSTDVWAVGYYAVTLHYDGVGWSQVPPGTTEWLLGVGGSSSNDCETLSFFMKILCCFHEYNGADGDADFPGVECAERKGIQAQRGQRKPVNDDPDIGEGVRPEKYPGKGHQVKDDNIADNALGNGQISVRRKTGEQAFSEG